MLNRLFIIVFLFSGLKATAQNFPLPVVKSGVWQLVDTNGVTVQTTPYSFIQTYDDKGFTFFHYKGAYGILDRFGKEVIAPVYYDAQQLGKGKYLLKSDAGWMHFETDKDGRFGAHDTIQSLEQINDNWAFTGFKDSLFLLNIGSGKRWKVNSEGEVSFMLDHALVSSGESYGILINSAGDPVMSGPGIYHVSMSSLFYFRNNGKHYLFDEKGVWPLQNVMDALLSFQTLFVRHTTGGALYDYGRNKLVSGAYEDITVLDERFYKARSLSGVTLIDRNSLKPLKPNVYSDIRPADENHYYVTKDGNTGYADQNLNELIPCKYSRFYIDPNGLVTTHDGDFSGLYSMKRKQEIIPAVYDRIIPKGKRYKAYRNELLDLYEIDENHKLINKASVTNAIFVKSGAPASSVRKRKFIDERLFSLGWFLDSTLVKKDTSSFYSLKWGLKGSSDSILLRPAIPDLVYVTGGPFTMENRKKQSFKVSESSSVDSPHFRAINHETGKALAQYSIVDYAETDWIYRDYMRFTTFKEFGILRSDGTSRSFSYLGSGLWPRYCFSKEVLITEEKKPDMTESPNLYISKRGRLDIHAERNPKMEIAGLIYPDGMWNFLTKAGDPMFKDTFSFAHEFVGKQAIVRKGKSWGVVSTDSIIIPTRFADVQRKVFNGKTFFVTQLNQAGLRWLDTTVRVLDITEISGSNGTVAIQQNKTEKWIIGPDNKRIVEGYSSYKFLRNGFILAKMKKELAVFNEEGQMLFQPSEIPESYFGEKYMLIQNGSTFSLYNQSNEEVLVRARSIEQFGPFIVEQKEGKTTVYDFDLKPVLENAEGKLLFDTIDNKIAVLDNGSVQVFNSQGKRTAKIKSFKPDHFHAGRFIDMRGDSCGIFNTNGTRVSAFAGIEEVNVLPNGAIEIQVLRSNAQVYDRTWRQLLEKHTFRKVKYLGMNVYSYVARSGRTIICSSENEAVDSTSMEISGKFSNSLLLVKKAGGYSYLRSDLTPLTKSYFSKAKPFSGNHAAVGDKRGWTLIDENGHALSYPNFGTITALHPALFETGSLPFYGLYDEEGKLLIPIVYEQLNFLSNGMVQAVKAGEVTYFRTDGTRVFE